MEQLRLRGSNGRAIKVEFVAAFADDVPLELDRTFTFGVSNKTPDFLKAHPRGKIPVLETPHGPIYESHAICRYIAAQSGKGLYPTAVHGGADVRAAIDGWIDWTAELDARLNDVGAPLWRGLPAGTDEKEAKKKWYVGYEEVKALIAGLDRALAGRTWLVGERLTLADVMVAYAMRGYYLLFFDSAFRKQCPHAARWLATVYAQPAWLAAATAPAEPPAKAFTFADAVAGKTFEKDGGQHAAAHVERYRPTAWSGDRVRQAFLDFFASKGHTIVPSSSVVPHNDPTLLFANAGMNQFKPVFLGTADPNSGLAQLKRAADSQKCIRAGGKHNDLDDVGKDVYHHTFFEMLGNWSFGDYFKAEAIGWAWELLTGVYKLDSSRLYATYFGGDASQGLEPDEEARQIWTQYLPPERILPFDCKDNFWEMGDQGPCGPCTEIHYDRLGGRDAAGLVNMDDPMVLEIWNLVFIQFNREADKSLKPLPSKHVDTGMGMERVTSVLQGKVSNYATDIFGPIFDEVRRISGALPYEDRVGPDDDDGKDMAYRVVADHIRTLCFAIADGAQPGNEGRDYVLRRVLRRAVRYGRQTLNAKEGFFAGLVDTVVRSFGGFYPELRAARDTIYSVIRDEEASFSRTLLKGIEKYKKAAAVAKEEGGAISGATAFDLWETSGFPLDLTQLMAEEDGLAVDVPGYEAAMEAAREKSRAASKKGGGGGLKFEAEATAHLQRSGVPVTDDKPKYQQRDAATRLLAILSEGGFVQSTEEAEGGAVGLVLESTSFYAEQGGQVGDTGAVEGPSGSFTVEDTRVAAGYVLHVGRAADGAVLKVGDSVTASVDYGRRRRIVPNHTFTHVLNLALRDALGDHVDQKGSIVLPERLRFDFSHSGVISPAKLKEIEDECKAHVGKALSVFSKEVPLEQARPIRGLRAVFGEVYPDPVRVVSIGKPVEDLLAEPSAEDNFQYSIEFCGGTHLGNTSEAGAFALMSEEGIAKGVRRIVAVTAAEAEAAIAEGERLIGEVRAVGQLSGEQQDKAVSTLKQTVETAAVPAVAKAAIREQLAAVQKALIEQAKKAGAAAKAHAAEAAVREVEAAAGSGARVAVFRLDVGLDAKALTEAWAACQRAHPELPVMFLSADTGKKKVLAWAGVPPHMTEQLSAGDWVKPVALVLGGKGGGKPAQAQCQGPNVDSIEDALQAAIEFAALKLE